MAEGFVFECQGSWTQNEGAFLEKTLADLKPGQRKTLIINGQGIEALDSAGAFLLQQYAAAWQTQGGALEWQGFSQEHLRVFQLLDDYAAAVPTSSRTQNLEWVQTLGQKTILLWQQILAFNAFIGVIVVDFWGWCRHPQKIRFKSICFGIQTTGTNAIPLVIVLSFLIGVVLAYQVGVQLRNYGANIFVVDFLGLAILREFGPMITAIIIAGRTGSSFAAQIGTMKLTEEVAALQTMGLSPVEVLVLPRMIALLIALPLLVILSEVLGLFGGMVMARVMLALSFTDFLHRFADAIVLSTFVVGLIKVPVFAFIIASIGTFQGFQVKDSAASVGEHTTISVVQAIFMIILADAAFSIVYSHLGI